MRVRVPKLGALRLKLTAVRAIRLSITVTLPGGRHRRSASVRVARLRLRAHRTRTIVLRFSKGLRRALADRRMVKVTLTAH